MRWIRGGLLKSSLGIKDNKLDQKVILVVDDDNITRQILDIQLKGQEYRVLLAEGGHQAMKLLESDHPDLILLDLMMPGMNGLEVCKKIREKYNPEILPIVMLTAKNQPTDLVEGFRAGASDYLVKPYMIEELQVRVQMHLRLKDAFETLKENQRLKVVIEQKEQAEQEVLMAQRRLSRILDNAREAILSVNEIGQIIFLNRSLEQLLGYDSKDVIGQPIYSLIAEQAEEESNRFLFPFTELQTHQDDGPVSRPINLEKSDGEVFFGIAYISLFELDEESVYVISIVGANDASPILETDEFSMHTPKLIAELNRNRKRIHDLEDSLIEYSATDKEKRPDLLHELKKIDSALDNLARSFFEDEKIATARELTVEVMSQAVDYWNENTGLTRADLARKSRIWKVYLEQDGRERTQTLDKYLDLESLPRNPGYKKVIRTADFVLTSLKTDSSIRHKLELSLAKLQALT